MLLLFNNACIQLYSQENTRHTISPDEEPSGIFPTNDLSKDSLTTSFVEASSSMVINPVLKMI